MLFLSVSADGRKLVHVCKNCNTTHSVVAEGESLCVSETVYGDEAAAARALADPSIKFDPTLPRVSNITCPRGDMCPGHGKQQDVIFLKYNASKLRYMYFCCHCDNFWRTSP